MKIGLFYELQLPRPWDAESELRIVQEALDQIELADRLGFHCVWAVEHHFLEEYSHCSAPEVLLAAASQRTKNIRLGHGIVPILPNYNHPARVAERIGMLDLVSRGRVEFGTGETGSPMEWGGFGVDPLRKRDIWEEVLPEIPKMMVQVPYAGFEGSSFSMPVRNVLPKPLQKPHPPMWMACSKPDRIITAAEHGIGALSFAFVEPHEAQTLVNQYHEAFAERGVPVGYMPNANLAFVTGFFCAASEQAAIDQGIDGSHFFAYSIGHYAGFGQHQPGKTDINSAFHANREEKGLSREAIKAAGKDITARIEHETIADSENVPRGSSAKSLRGAIGTPDQIRDYLRGFEEAGADQVILIAQHGATKHEDICASLELFGREVLPEFIERDVEAQKRKQERLTPVLERVMARRPADRKAEQIIVPPVAEYMKSVEQAR